MLKPLAFATLVLLLACSSDSTSTAGAGAGGAAAGGGAAGGMDAGGSGGADVGGTGGTSSSGGMGGSGGGQSCLDAGWQAGERYSLKDNCNFCDCMADGSSVCSARTCPAKGPGCSYAGVDRAYGERFPASDTVNECVCAASGLACTRRDPNLPEEGAILLESPDEPCGDDMAFTGAAVLAGIPTNDFTAPFLYNTTGPLYPETLADSKMRVRIVYDGGFIVCRIPSPTQPAIDIEAVVEWISEDGAFDEGHHTYLRRNNFGFVDAWLVAAGAPVGGLDGSYNPNCLDPNGFSFSAQVNIDGSAEGSIYKVCEIDAALEVGTLALSP